MKTELIIPEKYRNPHRRNAPNYGANLQKRVYLADRLSITADDVANHLTIGTMEQRERFASSLPSAICFAGRSGLNEAFRAWLEEEKLTRPGGAGGTTENRDCDN